MYILLEHVYGINNADHINRFRICPELFHTNSDTRGGGASVSTRCSELTLVCLSNSCQTRCQQPNTQADIGPRIQFMFARLEWEAEEQLWFWRNRYAE
jgi:hypothetical protein